jgi:hypothetical protein
MSLFSSHLIATTSPGVARHPLELTTATSAEESK